MLPLTGFKARIRSLQANWWPLRLWNAYRADRVAANAEALQAGLELASEGIVLLNHAGRVVAHNSRAQALAHSALAELRGGYFWDAIPEEIVEKHRSATELALQANGSHAFVVYHSFEDQWVEYDLRQHADGLLVVLRDVSAVRRVMRSLRDSELCNQLLFDAHTQAMWVLEPASRRILVANRASAALYGMSAAAMAGLAAEALFPPGEAADLLDALPHGDFRQIMRLCTQKKANGERMLVELTCASVQWLLGPAVLVSVIDVGARHLADTHLQRLNEELELRIGQCTGELQRSRHELETFTYAMSHDLKAPLHVIDGFATTLAERHAATLDAQGQHYVARIQASTRQLARMIDDLRTLTYLPRMAVTPELVDLAPLCLRLMEELRKREPNRHAVLEMEATLPLVCDRNMMALALACLLDNAWKFTSKKEQGWIKVALLPGTSAAETVLSVSDNGAGFDAAYEEKLFTAFERLHSSADFPGSGLGLAIVKRIAQMQGGEVWAVAAVKGGASFFMSVPQAQEAANGVSPDRLSTPVVDQPTRGSA